MPETASSGNKALSNPASLSMFAAPPHGLSLVSLRKLHSQRASQFPQNTKTKKKTKLAQRRIFYQSAQSLKRKYHLYINHFRYLYLNKCRRLTLTLIEVKCAVEVSRTFSYVKNTTGYVRG
jgi:hypothetical protein